jgi:MFS family permease
VRAVLRHRDARRYLVGQLLSIIGDTSLWLGVGIFVKELTGSSAQAGLTFFFFGLPYIAAPLLGLVVDRVRRRPLMIATNLASAGVVCALFAVRNAGDVWIVYVVMVLYGLSGALLGAAQSALLTVILPSELLGDANGFLQTGREVMRLITPLVGAGVVAATHGVKPLVIADAVTFVIAAMAIASMRVDEVPAEPSLDRLRTQLVAGIRHVWATLPLRQIVIATGLAIFVVGMNETLVFAVAQGLGRSASFVGVIVALQGLGAVAGGPLSPTVLRRIGDGWTVALGLCLIAVAELGMATGTLPGVVIGVVIGGIGVPLLIVGFATSIQLRTPPQMQGRVAAAADAIVSTPQTISVAIGAALVVAVDYRLLLLISAVTVAVAAGYLGSRPEHRIRRTDDADLVRARTTS